MTPDQLLSSLSATEAEATHQLLMILLAYSAVWLAMVLFGLWIVYMFYSRLRDIANELRYFRVAYQHAQDLRLDAQPQRGPQNPRPTPTRHPDDYKYMPKP